MLAHSSKPLHHPDDLMSTVWITSEVLIPANAIMKACISCFKKCKKNKFHSRGKELLEDKEAAVAAEGEASSTVNVQKKTMQGI